MVPSNPVGVTGWPTGTTRTMARLQGTGRRCRTSHSVVMTSRALTRRPRRRYRASEAVAMAVVALILLACLALVIARPSARPTEADCAELWETGRHSSELVDVERDAFIAECLAP